MQRSDWERTPNEELLAVSAVERLGTPEDIAAVVEFLVNPQSAFIIGCRQRERGST